MTPDREKLIRSQWNRHQPDGLNAIRRAGMFRAPVPERISASVQPSSKPETGKLDVFEYTIEHGTIDHKPMSRVLCEGIEVEVFPRDTHS